MKKYLATICALMMLTSFASCGDTPQNNSEPSSSISESATEEITTEPETTTEEPTTEKSTTKVTTVKTTIPIETDTQPIQKKIILDSELDCNYLKIATCSKWEEKSTMNEGTFNAFWDWGDVDEGPYYFISLELDKTSMGKMSQSDLQEYYKGYFEYRAENNENKSNEEEMNILDSFVQNGQAYIILGYQEKDLIRMIHFSTDNIEGHFVYSSENEDIVIDMIKSISFNENSNISLGEKNALEMAKNYLEIMPFSYNSLIEQLEFEKFTHEQAVYGADNCGANWNEQAAKTAQSYIDSMPFSRDELIDQLIFEGFTQEQAEYGVNLIGY